MESLKIVIGKNKDVANQAKDLLPELGLYVSSEKRHNFYGWVARVGSGDYINDISVFNKDKAKLVTIQDLKDMVVLKRNDESDASHVNENTGELYRVINDVWHVLNEKWEPSSRNGLWIMAKTKPIKEVVMKEYLVKTDNGNYRYTGNAIDVSGGAVIEIPEGTEVIRKNYSGSLNFYKKIDGRWAIKNPVDMNNWYLPETYSSHFDADDGSLPIVWQREKESTMQEQLDYADELRDMGESGWSKEKHSHYKKDISHLNMIDPYRIADLYALHPCAEHIMKKSLCAGNRGHKDTLRDIQDIIDTAERWKQMIEEDNNEI